MRECSSSITGGWCAIAWLIDFPVKAGKCRDGDLPPTRNVQFLMIRERIVQRISYASGISTDL